MNAVVEPTPAVSERARRAEWSLWLALGALALLWLDLIHQLSYMWSSDEQYAFGWFVPLLALGLAWQKWATRPAPRPGVPSRWAIVALVVVALVFPPARVVEEVNQDWALFSWLMATTVVGLSLYAVYLAGGPGCARHFAFPICFILVAVRWPYRVENSLTYRLMGVVTTVTTEIVNWVGIPAVQHGHLIETASGTVGIEEACSGIRSFQSSIMAALLMGELYRLRRFARGGMIFCGVGLAFGFNVLRTTLLTWQEAEHGSSALERWHDPAGITITIACFFSLWAIAVLFRKWWATPARTPRAFSEEGRKDAAPIPADRQLARQAEIRTSPRIGTMPRWFAGCLGGWTAITLLGNQLWYHTGQGEAARTVQWQAAFPTNMLGAATIPISEPARNKLKYDSASTLSWQEPDGSKWSAYYFRWNPGSATSRLAAQDHRPEYCIGGSGYTCVADLGVQYFKARGLALPFRSYVFKQGSTVLYVFDCLWQDGAEHQKGFGASKYIDRLTAVLRRQPLLGQRVLEIIVSGYPNMAEAEKAVRARLPSLIQRSVH